MEQNATSLGHFLDYKLWGEGLGLLKFQLECKKKNRHFNTLSMFYYERLGSSVDQLSTEEYFKSIVANNLFYGLSREFAAFPYVIPKGGIGLRKYKFMTYPLRTLYYSIGLYLLKLSQEFLTEYVGSIKSIQSYYGGDIKFEKDSLILTKDNVYFKRYYKKFRSRIRKLVGGQNEHRVIITLDIENYYDSISVTRLLEQITHYAKTSYQKSLKL